LPYDLLAAKQYSQLQETARLAGRQLTVEDGMTLAICQANAATLATRNIQNFDYLTNNLINPWAN